MLLVTEMFILFVLRALNNVEFVVNIDVHKFNMN